MLYHVRARLRPESAPELMRKLGDGTIAGQTPDGAEIVASLDRAVVTPDGVVEWTEMCFCSPPLKHERATVLDAHFTDIATEPVGEHQRYEGTPFMQHLKSFGG